MKIPVQSTNDKIRNTRAMTQNRPIEFGTTPLQAKACICDTIKLWNIAPSDIKNCTTLYKAKKLTKICVKSIPI